MKQRFQIASVLALLTLSSGCRPHAESAPAPLALPEKIAPKASAVPPPALTPITLAVVAAQTAIPSEATTILTATATTPGKPPEDVSTKAVWTVSNELAARVECGADGCRAIALMDGWTTITATWGGASASASLQVTRLIALRVMPPAVKIDFHDIAVNEDPPEVPVSAASAVRAVGTLSDGAEEDVTSSVIWASSDASSVVVQRGVLTAHKGEVTVTITASLAGLSAQTTAEVGPTPEVKARRREAEQMRAFAAAQSQQDEERRAQWAHEPPPPPAQKPGPRPVDPPAPLTREEEDRKRWDALLAKCPVGYLPATSGVCLPAAQTRYHEGQEH